MRPYNRAHESEEGRFHIEEQGAKEEKKEETPQERFKRILEDIEMEDDSLMPGTEEYERMVVRNRYLTPVDRAVIRQGLEKLDGELGGKDASELPDVVIFPDTAARPLFYAVKPLFDRLYEEKGVPPPDYRFLVTWREYDDTVFAGAGIDEESEDDPDKLKGMLSEALDKVEEPVRERIDEIIAEKGGHRNMLVIDDYSAMGSTVRQLDRLLGEAAEGSDGMEPKADFFTFYGDPEKDGGTGQTEGCRFFRSVTAGTSKEHVFGFLGFDYRARGDSLFPEEEEQERFARRKAKMIGVEKKAGEKYAKKSELRDQTRMRGLRQTLTHEGLRSIEWIDKEKERD